MHDDQLTITGEQVASLVADQLPLLAGQPILPVHAAGTVHAIFRIGDELAARFPLRSADPAGLRARLERETAAAAEFHAVCPFPSPWPLLVGLPGHGYPLPWTVQTWLPGDTATPTSCAASNAFAGDLAVLIARLRHVDVGGRRFQGDGRGGVLADHDEWVDECIRRSDGLLDTAAMRRRWAAFRVLPREDPDVFSHTDLIPGNLLAHDGRLAGVLDTGGAQPADPALDLVVAWHCLDDGPREHLRRTLGCSDLQWERGKAWAFQQAAGALWYYQRTNPAMARMARTTLARLLPA